MTEYLYVMDYNDHTLNCIEVESDGELSASIEADTAEILSEHGFDIDDCAVMWTTDKIKQINNFQHEHLSD